MSSNIGNEKPFLDVRTVKVPAAAPSLRAVLLLTPSPEWGAVSFLFLLAGFGIESVSFRRDMGDSRCGLEMTAGWEGALPGVRRGAFFPGSRKGQEKSDRETLTKRELALKKI